MKKWIVLLEVVVICLMFAMFYGCTRQDRLYSFQSPDAIQVSQPV